MRHYMIRRWRRYLLKPALIVCAVGIVAAAVVFARPLSLAARGEPRAVVIRAIPEPIRRVGEVTILGVQDFLHDPFYRFRAADLPRYEVRLDPSDWETLLGKVPKEDVGVLPEEAKQSYKAELIFDGKTYPAKIDIRGDTSSHWLYRKKSWQVKLRNGEALPDETEELNFIVPVRRYWVYEQFSNERARKLGLKVPRSEFAHLSINGHDYGVYFFLEGWEEFFRREGIAPTDLFAERSINERVWDDITLWKKIVNDPAVAAPDFSALDRLLRFVRESDDETFARDIFSIIDEENFYAWWVHMTLSGSTHQDWAHNLRIYVDRSSGKLKFVPWDVGAWPLRDFTAYNHFNPLISRMITLPTFREKRDRLVYAYVRDEDNVRDDLAAYDRIAEDARTALYQDRAKELPNSFIDSEIARYRTLLEENFHALGDQLRHAEANSVLFRLAEGGINILDLTTTSTVPIVVTDVFTAGTRTRVFFDANGNGHIDTSDPPLEPGFRMAGVPIPSDEDMRHYKPFLFQPARYRFLIPADSVVDIDARNAVTGEEATISQSSVTGAPPADL